MFRRLPSRNLLFLTLFLGINCLLWWNNTKYFRYVMSINKESNTISNSTRYESNQTSTHTSLLVVNENMKPFKEMSGSSSTKTLLTIGIPSARRPGGISYLQRCLYSLFENVFPGNRHLFSIVVYVAENDQDYINEQFNSLNTNFYKEIESGQLEVISPPEDLHNFMGDIKLKFGDSVNRTAWRTKQAFDLGYLTWYCRCKSDYYLALEDDVIAAKGYIEVIKDTIKSYQVGLF